MNHKPKINRQYAKLVPPLAKEEYDNLENSIKKDGLWKGYEILVSKRSGFIVDGMNRETLCKKHKKNPRYVYRNFESELEEKKFIIENILARRNPNDFQKIMLAKPLIEIETKLARQRKLSKLKHNKPLASIEANGKGKAAEIVAKKIGVSTTILEHGILILKEGTRKEKDNLLNDPKHFAISKVYKQIITRRKREQRNNHLKTIQTNLPNGVQLFNKPFQQLDIKENSVSLVFTDPPYRKEDLYLYRELARQAKKVLQDGGSLMCFAGHYCIDEIIQMITGEGLTFHWPCVVLHSGPSVVMYDQKVHVGYKPLLWFTKGKYKGNFVKDVIKSEFQGKDFHKWAQSTLESDYYIKYMTIENDIVYDPFMGQGTFGISAIQQGRQFIGAEIEKEYFLIAEKKLSTKL